MLVDAGLRKILADNATIAALCGTRVHPFLRRKRGEGLPAILYSRISTVRDHTQQGDDGLSWARFQIDVLAATRKVARELAETVRLLLDTYSGTVGDLTIDRVFIETDRDWVYEGGEEEGVERVMLEFVVWFRETRAAS